VRNNGIFIGTAPLVSFAEEISPKYRRYYESLLMHGVLAMQNNEHAKVYRFYDEAEARKFDRF